MFGIICLVGFAGAVIAMTLIYLFHFKNKSIVIPYIIFFVCIAVVGVSAVLFIKDDGGIAEKPSAQPSQQLDLESQSMPSDNATEGIASSANIEDTFSSEEILSFDERTWSDFKKLYVAHNALMDAMQGYANGTVTIVSFYDYCREAESFFADASLSFNYGDADYQNTYLSAFQSMALSDQMAAKSLLKYLDSFKVSDLSEAEENINNAKDAVITIASNRGELLVMAGLSDEEIREKVESDTADLG